MRQIPEDKYDKEDLERLKASPWQIDLLKLNPSYVYWGNGEDYMSDKNAGWRSPVRLGTWGERWELDELNELVNFYFEVYRKNHECPHCEGSNQNPATKQIADDWYDFEGTGRRWCDNIGETEVLALMKSGRIRDVTNFNGYFDEETGKWMEWKEGGKVEAPEPKMPTPEAVNAWSRGPGFGHDAINRWICVEARAKEMGVYGHCEHCEGGYIYDEPKARVGLQLWYLHPRKGTSRGVYIESIEEGELPEIFAYLSEAAKRNQQRFSKAVKAIKKNSKGEKV